MKKLYIITGASGHLGSTIIRMLKNTDSEVRGLILPSEQKPAINNIRYYTGDVTDKDSLREIFQNTSCFETAVIHTAGIIDISDHVSPLMYNVNVNGTKNIISLCMEYKVGRLLYVSSVHAIPEKKKTEVQQEVKKFSPELVVGGYAKTKAEATQAVLEAVHDGLDAVIVHPSGIIGPFNDSGNHLVQLIKIYINGKLPACVKGGYDFVDVRDVAYGCIAAAIKGRCGECYILSNRHYEVKELLEIAKDVYGGRKLPVLPMWMAKAVTPVITLLSKLRHQRPLYSGYSLYTLSLNDRFDHDKATAELNYRPRDLYFTIRDTVKWLRRHKTLSSS